MAKNNDAGVLLFFGRKLSIAVGVQESKNCLMSVLAAMILKGLDESAGSIFFAQALDELDFRVNAIIVANVTADKSDDNDGWSGRNACRGSWGL